MREMGYQVARRHAEKLRGWSAMLLFLLPLAACRSCCCSICRTPCRSPIAALAVAQRCVGVLIERWLFFAEAEHVVMLYYRGGVA